MSTATAQRIKALAVTIGFSEHPQHKTSKTFRGPDCWEQANAYLRHLAVLAPRDLLGYYKTDFTVEWENGETYEGRLDLKNIHAPDADCNVQAHIYHFALCHSGRQKPRPLSDSQSQILNAHFQEGCNVLLDQYDIIPF